MLLITSGNSQNLPFPWCRSATDLGSRKSSSVSQMSGCELYLRTVTRSVQTSQYKVRVDIRFLHPLDFNVQDFNDCKINLLGVGETLVAAGLVTTSWCVGLRIIEPRYQAAVSQIARYGDQFINDGMTVLLASHAC